MSPQKVSNLDTLESAAIDKRKRFDLTRAMNWLVDRLLHIEPGEILNRGEAIAPTRDPAQALRKYARELTSQALDASGRHVDYTILRQSVVYSSFRQFTLALPRCKPDDLGNRIEQTAFWINLYNALIIDAVVHYQINGSLLSKPSLFRRAAYNVAGFRFSADDIEHGILRGNRPNPSLPLKPMGRSDPRRVMVIEPIDPRIHFALVCGAKSCPPISFYEGQKLDEQLDLAAGSFVNGGGVQFDATSNSLWLSRIFKWYQSDFGGVDQVLATILKYSKDENVRAAIEVGNPRIRYLKYDWNVNSLA